MVFLLSESAVACRVGTSLVPRPSYHGVPVRGPGNNSLSMRLIFLPLFADYVE